MKLDSVWSEGLSSEVLNKAEIELGENPESQEKALFELRTLINEKSNFTYLEDDTFLIRFLRLKKYDPKRTLKMVLNYFKFKSKYPGVMTCVMKKVLRTNHMFLSPVRTKDGCSVFVISMGSFDFDTYSVEEYFEAIMIYCEQAAEIETHQICGGHLIVDFKGITLRKMRHFSTPTWLSLIAKGLEDCWPFRMVGGHVVNEPFYISIPCSIGMPMLSKKMRERIHFHGSNLSSLHKLVPRECLPKELGGVFGTDDCESQNEIIINKQLEMELSKKYSFHRKPKKSKRLSSFCSLEDSAPFRMVRNLTSKVVT